MLQTDNHYTLSTSWWLHAGRISGWVTACEALTHLLQLWPPLPDNMHTCTHMFELTHYLSLLADDASVECQLLEQDLAEQMTAMRRMGQTTMPHSHQQLFAACEALTH
eukprot:2470401-Rhodomonas_salina.3